ncbi:hypothetical protein BGZ54_008973 [Gamsiella multidivaricata]|nr:hypothetical protein BGZ54_008973 [Gamsiella multidivaricata]
MSSSDTTDTAKGKPMVLIVGAGLAGLLMGTLLERMNVPYTIFERASAIKALGSVMTLGANILPVFEQLGILEDLKKIALPATSIDMYNVEMKKIGSVGMKGRKEITGYEDYTFPRPRLYEILLKQIPTHKVLMGKKVLKIDEKDNQARIHCADKTIYVGDILIGADGIHSGVRQSMFKHLNQEGLLPTSDTEDYSIGFTLVTGVATPKDPSKYPQLKDPFIHFSTILGGNLRAWSANNAPDNQICWGFVTQFASVEEARKQQFRNSEWGAETSDAYIKEFYDLPCPFGGIMGDLVDDTPHELISKVFVEEKLFDTWYYGCTVLIGDSCHKMLPGGGQGAVNAMQDAVVLANCLYDLVDITPQSITAAFQDYYDQRYPRAKAMLENSKMMSKISIGQTFWQRVARHVLFNYMPESTMQHIYAKKSAYRPQINWMPFVENRGTGPVLPQKLSRRYTEELSTTGTVV